MTRKTALITGVTGQDGSYLAEFLLEKGYEVHGVKRRSSSFNTQRIDHLYEDPHTLNASLKLHFADLTDSSAILSLIKKIEPDEIYNLGAQSHVAVSFDTPEYTADADAIGPLRILEAIRILGLVNKTRFYQASSSEMFGHVQDSPQTELTPFYPRSPYGVAKLYAHWITVNYREAHGIHASSGILFNHESPRRGETFVTRKITRGLTRIALGLQTCLYLGNLEAKRDWGHARDFMRAPWLMLQKDTPSDYVIATGEQYSVRDFLMWAATHLGITLQFEGDGLHEVAVVVEITGERAPAVRKGSVICRVDLKYFRPAEVDTLLGNPAKAKRSLGWSPTITAKELCSEMVDSDFLAAQREVLLRDNGHHYLRTVSR